MRRQMVKALALVLAMGGTVAKAQSHGHVAVPFTLVNEFVGNVPLFSLRESAVHRLGNGFQLNRSFITDDLKKFAAAHGAVVCNYLPPSSRMLHRMGGFPDTSEAFLAQQMKEMENLHASLGNGRVWWNIMPEYDQLGGPWTVGRSLDYGSRQSACSSWKNYYLGQYPLLAASLGRPPEQRKVGLLALNVLASTTHYSYALGADLCVLERSNDEIGDIQTGIAFVRGAARQYDRPWGIDISNWRSASDSPTQFDERNQLTGGWSTSYLRRHFYIAAMSGANMIVNEAMIYFSKGQLNPLGRVIKEVSDFFVVKHRNLGRTEVAIALMLDPCHGFEPKYGRYMQGNYVWYSRIPYSRGDFMIHNFLNMIYPGYWHSGTLPKEAPATPEAYRRALAAGADSRPWEPMGESRWGDHFDVILSDASAEALGKYRTIILVGDVSMTSAGWMRLRSWVNDGGTLVLNTAQVSQVDEEFLGVRLTTRERVSSISRWVFDAMSSHEPAYRYRVAVPLDAWVLADNGRNPLITSHRVGFGEVILTLPYYLQDETMGQILIVGRKLVDMLSRRYAVASVKGSFPIEYIINRDSSRVIATLVNNAATQWEGTVAFEPPHFPYMAREWLTDTLAASARVSGAISVQVSVPAYDLRIIALERIEDVSPESERRSRRSSVTDSPSRDRRRAEGEGS